MKETPTVVPASSSPGRYETAQRPGQTGEQGQRRPGPNPRSEHPTGPHAPYEDHETEGAPAIKHESAPSPTEAQRRRREAGDDG